MKLFCDKTIGVVNLLLIHGAKEKRVVVITPTKAEEWTTNFGLKICEVNALFF